MFTEAIAVIIAAFVLLFVFVIQDAWVEKRNKKNQVEHVKEEDYDE